MHDRRQFSLLCHYERGAPLVMAKVHRVGRKRLTVGNELPEARAARGICYQMDALVRSWILHPVYTPIVEQPRLSGSHVHGLIATFESNLRISHDGNMQANPAEPVIV